MVSSFLSDSGSVSSVVMRGLLMKMVAMEAVSPASGCLGCSYEALIAGSYGFRFRLYASLDSRFLARAAVIAGSTTGWCLFGVMTMCLGCKLISLGR